MKGLKEKILDLLKQNSKEKSNEKLTEKAFIQSITVSVFCVVLCMIALCSVTWAWFSSDVSSSGSILSGDCTVTVSIRSGGIPLEAVNGRYSFEANTDYEITLTAEGSAKTAYCIFVIDGKEYYTDQLLTVAGNNVMTFTLKFSEAKEIEILPRWGISSHNERTFSNGKNYVDIIKETI